MDLGDYDETEAETALSSILTDLEEDDDLVQEAAESLGNIWSRKGNVDRGLVEKMHRVGREYFQSWLR